MTAFNRAFAASSPERSRRRIAPTAAFLGVAALYYGVLLLFSVGRPITLAFANKDAWQHLAALQALIDNPWRPANPFVATPEASRLFGPVHVAGALAARLLGLSALGAYGLIAGFNLLALAVGQWLFGRAYFRNAWGPLALLAAMAAGWWVSFIHTGFHSTLSLLEGAEYPATTGVALGLVLWGLTLRLLAAPRWSLAYPLLVALLLANHPLSAVIAFVGAGCLVLLEPGAVPARVRLAVMGAAGCALAAAWPYANPYAIMQDGGSAAYTASIDFYSPGVLLMTLWPAAFGVLGLRRSTAVMLALYGIGFLAGLHGLALAHRFLMPVVLTLHVGLAALILRYWSTPWRRSLIVAVAASLAVQLVAGAQYVRYAAGGWRSDGDLLSHARALRLKGVVAADDLAAWPVVAGGVKVVATPLPDPVIRDQAQRQADNAALFSPTTPLAARIRILRRYGVRSLVVDTDFARPGELQTLDGFARRVAASGPLIRYDVGF